MTDNRLLLVGIVATAVTALLMAVVALMWPGWTVAGITGIALLPIIHIVTLAPVLIGSWRALRTGTYAETIALMESEDVLAVEAALDEPGLALARFGTFHGAVKTHAKVLRDLTERCKELEALATTIEICFGQNTTDVTESISNLATSIPEYWLYPEHAMARIVYGTQLYVSERFVETPWRQSAAFTTMDGIDGRIEVFYRTQLPDLDEGPFLKEERVLLTNLTGLLRGYLDRKIGQRNQDEMTDTIQQLQRVVSAALQGDFTQTIDTPAGDHSEHGLRDLINRLMSTVKTNLDAMCTALDGLADGDLSVEVHGRFEGAFARMQLSANRTIEQLRASVASIQLAADTIEVAASEIAGGNADLSRRTESQAASLEETTSAMDELTSTVRQNAEHAQRARELATAAAEVAAQGGSMVEQVIDTMGQISESSERIGDITSVIDGIAFQTNILALNAAVEAARAGAQGHGFAVVASEVRALAQRSAEAAKQIKGLIEASRERVNTGAKLVSETGNTIGKSVQNVQELNTLIGEIAMASDGQAAGIKQVNATVAQMDEVTQQNAALVEEASASARSLKEQAADLTRAVATFRLTPQTTQRRRAPADSAETYHDEALAEA